MKPKNYTHCNNLSELLVGLWKHLINKKSSSSNIVSLQFAYFQTKLNLIWHFCKFFKLKQQQNYGFIIKILFAEGDRSMLQIAKYL